MSDVSEWLAYVFAGLIGIGIALQAVTTSTLSKYSGSSSFSVLMSFGVGVIPSVVYFVIEYARGQRLDNDGLHAAPWWSWIGGVFGSLYVITIAILTQKIGVTVLSALVFAAQMIIATLIDHYGWLEMSVRPLTLYRTISLVLLIVGSILLILDNYSQQLHQ